MSSVLTSAGPRCPQNKPGSARFRAFSRLEHDDVKLKQLPPRIKPAPVRQLGTLPPPSKAPGYRLRGWKLTQRRERYLSEHPLCAECERLGAVTPAAQLDHIVALHVGGSDEECNWQGLCLDCHRAKTAVELKAGGGSKVWR